MRGEREAIAGFRRRLVVVAAVALFAALLAPQAFGATSIQVMPTGNGTASFTGDSSVVPANLVSCTYSSGLLVPSPCSAALTGAETQVRIAVSPAAGTSFLGWGGTCPTTAIGLVCTVPAGNLALVPGAFILRPQLSGARILTVAKGGNGSGTVTSNPAGINCGSACTAGFAGPTVVTLTATPATGSVFTSWGGACAGAGSNPVCTVPLSATATTTVTATFTSRPLFTLTVNTAGGGNGTVTSSPAGLSCPPTCAASVVGGTAVTLTGTPAQGSVFAGFSGACSGQTCMVTVNSATSVTATFQPAVVQATLVSTKITKNGPRRAKRVLRPTVNAGQEVNVLMRIVRNGVTLASRRVRNVEDRRQLAFPIRNGISKGRARLVVTFTNEFGTTKTQSRRIKIPAV